jgi:hypothetical protein
VVVLTCGEEALAVRPFQCVRGFYLVRDAPHWGPASRMVHTHFSAPSVPRE